MPATAQQGWQNPPEPIASMLNAKPLPALLISPDNRWIVELERPALPPIAQLAEPVVAIAGIEVNPHTWGPGRESAYLSLRVRALGAASSTPVPLPGTPHLRNLRWSWNSRYLAFTLTQPNGIELWILTLETATARPLTDPRLTAVFGNPCHWLPGEQGLICKIRPIEPGPPPVAPTVPRGPQISSSLGRVAPTRTYTNLLKNDHDADLFEYYFSAQLAHVSLSGDVTPLTPPHLLRNVIPSPDGQWLLRSTFHRPFSYEVPLSRFPLRYEVLNRRGKTVYRVADLPLAVAIPLNFDSVRIGRRNLSWRHDQPATLYWVEALDGGDARQPADYRDAVYTLAAPFDTSPRRLWQSQLRFRSLTWGHDSLALVEEAWYDTRQLRLWQINPSDPAATPVLLNERDFQDAYAHPGDPMVAPGPYGWSTLLLCPSGDSLYLNGGGASPAGVFPFLDRLHLVSRDTQRLWQAQENAFTRVQRLLNPEATRLILRQESRTTPPDDYLLDLTQNQKTALTQFEDPLAWYAGVHKEVIRYGRADGVVLSATLYLPPDACRPLPTLLWVYPREYKDRSVAGQVTRSDQIFTRPSRASVLFLLTQGYAILAGPTMPIIGEGDAAPNDTYLEQLIASTEAAVDYLVERGIADRQQLAIGGHSYGAFTAVNLLAHSNLFQAGIARSGAYNRTLTPFGFQGEQRTFWEAPQTYLRLSPFIAADQITAPLLLIHGQEDRNSGTYPLQSERLYEALRGLGGTVRYVSLPAEGHSYRSREAVGHVLWEMVNWLDRYVKPIGKRPGRHSRLREDPA